jgi:hypothetical protein
MACKARAVSRLAPPAGAARLCGVVDALERDGLVERLPHPNTTGGPP